LFPLFGSEYKSRGQVSCYDSKVDFTTDKDEIDGEGKAMLHCVFVFS